MIRRTCSLLQKIIYISFPSCSNNSPTHKQNKVSAARTSQQLLRHHFQAVPFSYSALQAPFSTEPLMEKKGASNRFQNNDIRQGIRTTNGTLTQKPGLFLKASVNGQNFQKISQLLNFCSSNKVQSSNKQIRTQQVKHIILKKMNSSNLFTLVSSQMRERTDYTKILQQQSSKFDLNTYKIHNITCESMTKLYENIDKRYRITKELQVSENSWHENERRVFVWFIICFTYLKEKEENVKLQELTDQQDLWNHLSLVFFNKNPDLLQFQYLNMIKSKKRESWSESEDQYLLQALKEEEEGRWNEISKRMFYNSGKKHFRSPKQCRERWLNHLDTNKKRGTWTTAQDFTIFSYILKQGKHWSKIVPLLNNTRTQHMIKNRYNSLISKQVNSNNITQGQATEIIFGGLAKEMLKQGENSLNEEKSSSKGTDVPLIDEEGEKSLEKDVVLTPQPSTESVKSYEGTPSAVIFSYFMDYNGSIYISPIFNSTPSFYTQPTEESLSFKLSRRSSFTPFAPTVA